MVNGFRKYTQLQVFLWKFTGIPLVVALALLSVLFLIDSLLWIDEDGLGPVLWSLMALFGTIAGGVIVNWWMRMLEREVTGQGFDEGGE
ncbi:hypothetical protein [Kytococcus sedentarius]|uniref:hypothetical protein n=1 Tax=Kytococcus sedentarius TaxID=1276 RepID=UPI0035BC213D